MIAPFFGATLRIICLLVLNNLDFGHCSTAQSLQLKVILMSLVTWPLLARSELLILYVYYHLCV